MPYDKRVFTLVRSCLRQLLIAHYLERKEISNGVGQLLGFQWFVSKTGLRAPLAPLQETERFCR